MDELESWRTMERPSPKKTYESGVDNEVKINITIIPECDHFDLVENLRNLAGSVLKSSVELGGSGAKFRGT